MARGHCLNIFVVLAAVHGFLGLPGWRLRSSHHSLFSPPPPPPPSPSLISNLASVGVKQNDSLAESHASAVSLLESSESDQRRVPVDSVMLKHVLGRQREAAAKSVKSALNGNDNFQLRVQAREECAKECLFSSSIVVSDHSFRTHSVCLSRCRFSPFIELPVLPLGLRKSFKGTVRSSSRLRVQELCES